jgi:hypothetical protein
VTSNGHEAARDRDGEPLSTVPITVIIDTDYTGRIDIAVRGPIKGKAGLLALLDAARRIAEQMED